MSMALVYETCLVDKNFNLKTVKFYFNSFFDSKEPKPIRLPNEFHINKDYVRNIKGDVVGSKGQFIVEGDK